MSKSPIPYTSKLIDYSFIAGIDPKKVTDDPNETYFPEALLSYPKKKPEELNAIIEVYYQYNVSLFTLCKLNQSLICKLKLM